MASSANAKCGHFGRKVGKPVIVAFAIGLVVVEEVVLAVECGASVLVGHEVGIDHLIERIARRGNGAHERRDADSEPVRCTATNEARRVHTGEGAIGGGHKHVERLARARRARVERGRRVQTRALPASAAAAGRRARRLRRLSSRLLLHLKRRRTCLQLKRVLQEARGARGAVHGADAEQRGQPKRTRQDLWQYGEVHDEREQTGPLLRDALQAVAATGRAQHQIVRDGGDGRPRASARTRTRTRVDCRHTH